MENVIDYSEDINSALENTPEEVREFIFKGGLEEVKKVLLLQLQDTDLVNTLLMHIELFLLEIELIEDVEDFIETLPLEAQKKELIKTIIQERVIDELVLTIEAREEVEEELKSKNETSAPNTTLQTLKDRLTNTTLVAPIIKTVSSPEKKTIATSANESKTVDPYREIPE